MYLNKEIKEQFEKNNDIGSLNVKRKKDKKEDLFNLDYEFIRKIKMYRLFAEWEKIAGEALAKHSKPFKIENATLYLRIDNPAWKTELRFFSKDLIFKIKQITDLEIKHIRTV